MIKEAKMRASPELDNLLDAGSNFRTAKDGADGHAHKNSVGDFIYFDTIFKVNGEFYRGTINIQQVKNGKLLKDITKIENITQDITNSYGKTQSLDSCVMLLWIVYTLLPKKATGKLRHPLWDV